MSKPAFPVPSRKLLLAGVAFSALILGAAFVPAPDVLHRVGDWIGERVGFAGPISDWRAEDVGAHRRFSRTIPLPPVSYAQPLVSVLSIPLPPTTTQHGLELAAFAFGQSKAGMRTVAVEDTAGLARTFQRLGYNLEAAADGTLPVPRVIVTRLPPDFPTLDEIDLRKSVFFQVLLPLVLQANEAIEEQRQRLVTLGQRVELGVPLTGAERDWLDRIKDYYNVEDDNFDQLLKRVDVVPPSLALAQAAIESGWGTSRFAREGNALFGQYTNSDNANLLPAALPGDADVRIHAYGGLFEAVMSYARNLNTHAAYQAFRALRAKARTASDVPDGYALAGTLKRYSARGEDYVRDVRRVMNANDLTSYDDAWLDNSAVTRVVLGDT